MNRFLLIKELRSSGWRQWKNWGESSTLYQVALGMAGVVSVVCGFRARRSRAKDFYLAWAAVAVGLLTIVIGSVLVPNSVPPKTVRTLTSCINELRQIDGAKEQWVLENKKAVADTPTWPDLVGKHKYIKVMPECPGGGAYTINRMMA